MPIHVVKPSNRDQSANGAADKGDFAARPVRSSFRSEPAIPDEYATIVQGGLRFSPGSIAASASLFSSGMGWAVVDFAIAMAVEIGVGLSRALHSLTGQGGFWAAGLSFAIFTMICSRLSGLHRLREDRSRLIECLLIIQSVTLAAFALLGFETVSRRVVTTTDSLAVECLAVSLAMLVVRSISRWHRCLAKQSGSARRKILIVGADNVGREVKAYLTSLASANYSFSGFVLQDGDTPVTDTDVVGDIHNVIAVARSMFVEELIFTRRPDTPGLLSLILQQAKGVGIDVRLIPSLSETLINRSDVQYIDNLPTIAILHNGRRTLARLIKRGIDIVGALAATLIASPLFIAIAVAIKLSSPGPIFYISKRVGYKGTLFACYKFRTMVVGAASMQADLAHLNERSDILFKIANDPRVTPIGAVLRKYSLDELPQLWNVLRGDMSLVGPRPSIKSEVAQYKIAHLRRLDVMPGITGLWQVEARQNPSFDSYIALDSKYVNTWSIWLDLKILLRTFSAVIGGTGT